MKLTALLVLLFAMPVCYAYSFHSSSAAREYTDKIMQKVSSGDIEGGLKMIKPYTAIPSAEFDATLGQATLQFPAIAVRFGKSIGSEFISEVKVGESIERILYVQKFERTAMRWIFYIYKGSDGWTINSFKFDDHLTELF